MKPLLVRIQHAETHEQIVRSFASSPVRIGRNELNDLVLREPFISQWHSVVWFDETQTRYVDLGSTNGTTIDGRRAEKNVPMLLEEGVDVCVGPLHFAFLRAHMAAELLDEPTRDSRFFMAPPAPQGAAPDLSEGRTLVFDAMRRARGAKDAPRTTRSGAAQTQAAEVAARIAPAYDRYRAAWNEVFELLQREIGQLPRDQKSAVLIELAGMKSGLSREEDYRGIARALGISPAALGAVEPTEFIQRLGGTPGPDPALDMERVGALLESFAGAFIELRKGFEQFGKDMGVRVTQEPTPLHRAETSREVLSYLLDGSADGKARITEVTRGFAELAIHQIAVLSGVLEGVRALLERLSPHEIAGKKTRSSLSTSRAPGTGLLDLWIPFRPRGLWKRFVARHQGFVDEDRFTREVFGASFARAYHTVMGGHSERMVAEPGSFTPDLDTEAMEPKTIDETNRFRA